MEHDLLQEYLKALDLLTINETNRLRKKVDILKELLKLEDEIKTLKERLELYESQINQLTDSQKDIRDFMQRHDRELLRIDEMARRSSRLALAILLIFSYLVVVYQ